MARIRTIKPEFFRHELLQDLEIANPGKYPMMVFEALWGHCDSKGRFEWKPRTLKLDILPFIPFDMADTLAILENAGMLHRYTVDGKDYGVIETFDKHQRLSGKELTEGEKFPCETSESTVKQQGSVGEIPESQEGKGREEEGKGYLPGASLPAAAENGKSEKVETEFQVACRETWNAYANAYESRYSTRPIRNAKVSSQVKGFVERVGREESLAMASWFVAHPDAFYVKNLHTFGLLLADAEKLRTQWATGRIAPSGVVGFADKRQERDSAQLRAIGWTPEMTQAIRDSQQARLIEGEVL